MSGSNHDHARSSDRPRRQPRRGERGPTSRLAACLFTLRRTSGCRLWSCQQSSLEHASARSDLRSAPNPGSPTPTQSAYESTESSGAPRSCVDRSCSRLQPIPRLAEILARTIAPDPRGCVRRSRPAMEEWGVAEGCPSEPRTTRPHDVVPRADRNTAL
jgi:hypothetical protein